jgi:hypothetical protein
MISIEFKDLPSSKNQIENRKKKPSHAGMDIKKKTVRVCGLFSPASATGYISF